MARIAPMAGIAPTAVDYPYFFHISGQTDPYGSGHSYRQYYVPAGSDVPLLSFCSEMGKNAPPDSVKVAYTQVGAPGWSTALATYAPAILQSYGIDTMSDNQNRYWAMQDAVWALSGSRIGAAGGVSVIQSLIAAAGNSVAASTPELIGITNGGLFKAELYGNDLVRYGPFSITKMSGSARLSIYTDDGNQYGTAWLGDAAGRKIADQTAVESDTIYYVYIPSHTYLSQRINISLEAPYVLPSTMNAYTAPSSSYQNQIVMTNWTPRSGTIKFGARLGGYGKVEISKLDTGWRPGFSDNIYLLEGAKFKVLENTSNGFIGHPATVIYDNNSRTYRTEYLFETSENDGQFRLTEIGLPKSYRDPIIIDFSVKAKYDLRPDVKPGSSIQDPGKAAAIKNADGTGMFYALNTLLNVEIKMQKRDKAESGTGPAFPQGGATLAGAYYGLFYAEAINDASGLSHEEGELVCIGITDEGGKIVFNNSDALRGAGDRRLIWSNDNDSLNYGTEDFPIYLPVFKRTDPRIFPAKYYVQELVPSSGYLLDIDPDSAELDVNSVPLPGTGTAKKYYVDASDNGSTANPIGIKIETIVTEQVKMRGFLLRKIKTDGYETEVYNLNGAGFSVYLIDDLVSIIKKAAESDPSVKIPVRGPGGWNKQDFIDFFYDPDFEHPADTNTGKDWYNRDGDVLKGRYDFDLYPGLLRARIDYLESPVFYSGAALIPGLRYGHYGNNNTPNEGEVVFPEFPYGEYIVFETDTPAGVERIKPFIVNIAEDGDDILDGDGVYNAERPEQKWRIQVDSDMFSIRLWKKDAETGKTVIKKDAAFRIKYLGADGIEGGGDDKWVEMVIPGKNGIERYGTAENPFRVGDDGILILPKKLQAGSYKLYEIEAPDGYVLSYHEATDGFAYYYADTDQQHKHGYGFDEKASDANYTGGHYFLYRPLAMTPDPQPDAGIVFDINEAHRVQDFDIDTDGYDDFVLELIQFNEQQKGRLNIHKAKESPDVPEGTDMPSGRPESFAGVRFELYAADDIVSLDGHEKIIYKKGELVAAAETNSSGNVFFKDLYLGKYTLKEADIPDSSKIWVGSKLVSGYKFVDEIEIDLLPPAGDGLDKGSPYHQENPVISASWDMLDTWQLGRIEIHKSGETHNNEEPLEGARFEVICAEDIYDLNLREVILKKSDTAGTFTTDENGIGILDNLFPGEYILREVSAPVGYIFTEDKSFTIREREHPDPFEWYTFDITDVRQKLSIVIEKIDDEDGRVLAGALFGLYAAEDIKWFDGSIKERDVLISETVTDNSGKARFKDLPPGKYIVREINPPPGYKSNEKFAPEVTLSYEGNRDEYLTWAGICTDSRNISVEVDKDTIKRTAAAFVSLPGQAGHNNVGLAEERYRYDIDFRSTSGIWADEFVVDDPLENVIYGKIYLEELWTPVVWGDFDGLWNLWYATNKTDPDTDYSMVSAMDTNPHNPENPDRIAAYPNTGLKLLAQGLRTDKRYHFKLEDFGLTNGEYITKLRFEYGRVEVGFTSKNYSSVSLNGEHRKISGADLRLPSYAANELILLDPMQFPDPLPQIHGDWINEKSDKTSPGLGEKTERTISIDDTFSFSAANEHYIEYVTGIKGDVVDWTPIKGTRFYAEEAVDPGYELLPASYLVSAAIPMTDVDIVSSVSARIARDVTMRAYDQDAVVTKVISTFKYDDKAPIGSSSRTMDDYPLLFVLLLLLLASIGLLVLWRISLGMRPKSG
jgi:hypothetical protein